MEQLTISSTLIYISLFIGTYFEVFLLITFFEHRGTLKDENKSMNKSLASFPSVSIIIPCFNEESTVDGTIRSLLGMNYPTDKLKIIIVDDGSTDNTWQYIQMHAGHPQIEIYQKRNGGKYTALNYGIKKSKSDLIGCLDADSYVDKDTLRRIVRYFEKPKVMAVTPAIKIYKPKTFVQHMQNIEYPLSIMVKKILSYLNALYVTPGPFTIFRKDVFKKIGPFRHAHNTEDMEMAMRMHINHLKIENCHKGFVYTVGPSTLKKLYKQRVRWTHGFLENIIDYKKVLFNKKYGHVAFLSLPFSTASLFGVVMLVLFILWDVGKNIIDLFTRIYLGGFGFHPHFDLSFVYISTKTNLFITIALMSMTLILLLNGRKLTEEKIFSRKMLYFLFVYPFVAPLWIMRSVFNTTFRKKTSWR